MSYKIGDIVNQNWRPNLGNLIILKQIDKKLYKCKYINNVYNDGLSGETYEDAYIFHEVWLGQVIKSNSKHTLPGWF